MAIEGVIFDKKIETTHKDDRRSLIVVFNGDLEGFVSKQFKIADLYKDAILGGHYHNYRELFYLLRGEAIFDLKSIQNSETEHYELSEGSRLLIPSKVAHKAFLKKDSILLGFTEEIYISPEFNDHKYEF